MTHFQWKLPARKDGPANAHELATGAGLSYPVASRVWLNTPLARIDAETVAKLARYYGVKNRLALVELVDE